MDRGQTTTGNGTSGNQEEHNVLDTLLRFFIGGGLGFIICILVLLALSALISGGALDSDYLYQYAVGSCIVSVFSGVKLAKRFFGEISIPGAISVGVIFFLLLLLVGYVGYSSMTVEHGGIGLGISSVVGGALAGVPLPMVKKKGKSRRK